MPKYAILSNNQITNIIIADSLEIAKEFGDAVEYPNTTSISIGGYYNKETNEFLYNMTESEGGL